MRAIGWAAVIVVFGWAGWVEGGQPGCVGCASSSPWCMEACATPPGYTLRPGCCEPRRPCCDNAWAGYCEHRSKMNAYWTGAGNRAACVRARPCRQDPMGLGMASDSCSAPTMQPTPAVPR